MSAGAGENRSNEAFELKTAYELAIERHRRQDEKAACHNDVTSEPADAKVPTPEPVAFATFWEFVGARTSDERITTSIFLAIGLLVLLMGVFGLGDKTENAKNESALAPNKTVSAAASFVMAAQGSTSDCGEFVRTGDTYETSDVRFDVPAGWRCLAGSELPAFPGYSVVGVASADGGEFALLYFQAGSSYQADPDILYEVARRFGSRNGNRDSALPAFKLAEVYAYGRVETELRRMMMENDVEFIGSRVNVPRAGGASAHMVYVVYMRHTSAPPSEYMGTSTPGRMRDSEVPAYVRSIGGRQTVMNGLRFADVGERPASSINGRWSGVGAALDIDLDGPTSGRFVRMYHYGPGAYSRRDGGTFTIFGDDRIRLSFESARGQREQECAFALSRDDSKGQDLLTLCDERYWKDQ